MTTIRKLGWSEDEIKDIEKNEGQMKKSIRKALVELHACPPASDSDITKLESIVGKLPNEYTEFLKNHNGGSPEPNVIVTDDNERVINFFLPVNFPNGYSEHLLSYFEKYTFRIPRNMLPIASAGGGDLILIGLNGNHFGKIFYWSHELEADDNASDYFDNIELIANSLTSLFGKFCEIDE